MAAYRQVSGMIGYQVYIGSKVTDEKLAKILQVIDDIEFGDDEVWLQHRYGKPGVHFDWQGEPWKSMPITRKPEDVPEGYSKQGGWFTSYPPVYTTSRLKFIFHTRMAEYFQNWVLAPAGQEHALRAYREDTFNETNLREVNQQYGETLNTMHNEFYMQAVIGEVNIDAEWDAYVEKWLASGGKEYLAELEKAPLVSGLRKGERIY